ncbi:MAG: fumarylacetoacetate hydrolase family protein [Gammaproteobacteria bacterium]|nr:fumarylacetoacetate hydrolase family protein [Gammaproteobacteria bacterium]
MRFVTYRYSEMVSLGLLAEDGATLSPLVLPVPLHEAGVRAVIEAGPGARLETTGERLRLVDVDVLAPIPRPRRNVFCIGKNYREHVMEFARSGYDAALSEDIPETPIVFSKLPSTVIAPGLAIRHDPRVTQNLDYEAELAVIIGTGGRDLPVERALDHVWGYTTLNDVTARDVQKIHKQWLLGKSQDTFCPMGPVAVTREHVDLANTRVRCWVNGELRQDGNTNMMIFDVPTLIATISRGITLEPGDIIATGTPAGVGVGFKPPRFLKGGDRIRIEIDGLGVLENDIAEVAA